MSTIKEWFSKWWAEIIIIVLLIIISLSLYWGYKAGFLAFISGALYGLPLIWIAYTKMSTIATSSRIRYLMDIDKRWMSPEIIAAKTIIHKIYLEIKNKNVDYSYDTIEALIGEKILEMHKSEEGDDIKDSISLLSYLEFMETIGYLHRTQKLRITDIEGLCGHSIKFNYCIYRSYIKYKQTEQDEKFFIEFEALYYDLICHERKNKAKKRQDPSCQQISNSK